MKKSVKEYNKIGETLHFCELDNGLRICVVPKKGFSSCYAVLATNYGGAMRRFEVDGKVLDTPAGIAHFLEHKMFDMPDGSNVMKLFSEHGADPNAYTSSGETCYHFSCTSDFEENLRLLLKYVYTPYFTPETVQKEQGIIGQEILMGLDAPGSRVYYDLLSLLYDHHPIKDQVAGTVESIAQITDQTLYDCHRIFYSPSNMVLAVEGDVDPEAVFAIAEEMLPAQRMPVPHADYGEAESLLPLKTRISREMPVSAPLYYIGAKVPYIPATAEDDGHACLKDGLVGDLALKLLLGRSSPFYTRLYASGLLTLNFDYEYFSSAETSMVIIGGESPDPEKVYSELVNEVSTLTKKGFDPDYFNRAYCSTIGARLRGSDNFDDVCDDLALGILEGYCDFDAAALMETVTCKDCENWIAANLAPERLAMAVIMPVKA